MRVYWDRLWFIDDKEQMAFISEEEGVFLVTPYKKTKEILNQVADFSIFHKRLYAVNDDGVLSVFSIRRPTILQKITQNKEKEVYTTIEAYDMDHFILASAYREPNKNVFKANVYLLGPSLRVRDKLVIDCSPTGTGCNS